MRFVIYGAGGVGGVIGAQLVKSGTETVLIARGRHLDAMQTQGLRYETPHEKVTIPVTAVGHPGDVEFRDSDVVFLAMKSQHTLGALEDLRRAGVDGIPIICCQNGVANEAAALRRFPKVYAMWVYLPAQFTEPGRVQCHGRLAPGVLDLGLYPRGSDALATEISQRLEAADISSRADPEVMRLKYAKLLTNLKNGLEAVLPEGETADDILSAMKEEGRACFRAAGIDWAIEDEVRARLDGVFAFGEIPGAGRLGGSSRQSLLRGTGDIETDYLNGEIVLLGRLHGVPTPSNTVIQHLSNQLARSRQASSGSISVEQLRRLISAVDG